MSEDPAPEHGWFFCVICAGCGVPAPVMPDRSRGRGRFLGPCALPVTCRTCGLEREYPREAVRSLELP